MNRGEKQAYLRDYAQAKKEGKPFFPYAVYKDLIVATISIAAVVALAIGARVGVGEPVNPATSDFVPRPEWYFFFLFELLKVFEGQHVLAPVIMATFIVPNILMALLILWPFIDRSAERRPNKRPISMVAGILVIAFLGYTTYLASESPAGVAAAVELEGLDAEGEAGLAIYRENNCNACHMIKGAGQTIGPDLTTFGERAPEIAGVIAILDEGPGIMPSFEGLADEDKELLAGFLGGLGTDYR